jgi:hypothetical protein
VSFERGVLFLKGSDELRENEKLIASNEENKLRIGGISVQVRDVIDVGDMEDVSRLCGGIIRSLAPGRHGLS